MSLLVKIRNLFYILRIFYWYAFKASVKALLGGNLQQCQYYWDKLIWKFLNFKIYKIRGSEEMNKGKTLVFSNHRSQADFWLHDIITEQACNFLSRLLVGVVFFIFGIAANKTVWFFNRSANIDHNKFNEWLNKKFTTSPRPSLLAYPQGHRMAGTVQVDKSKIKTGMIRYAYREKIKVQLLMTFGNENVFNEKKLHMGWDQKIYYSFGKIIDPSTFATEAEFVTLIKDEFCLFFDKIYKTYAENGEAQEIDFFRNADN